MSQSAKPYMSGICFVCSFKFIQSLATQHHACFSSPHCSKTAMTDRKIKTSEMKTFRNISKLRMVSECQLTFKMKNGCKQHARKKQHHAARKHHQRTKTRTTTSTTNNKKNDSTLKTTTLQQPITDNQQPSKSTTTANSSSMSDMSNFVLIKRLMQIAICLQTHQKIEWKISRATPAVSRIVFHFCLVVWGCRLDCFVPANPCLNKLNYASIHTFVKTHHLCAQQCVFCLLPRPNLHLSAQKIESLH